MEVRPTVSVVINTYNHRNYISEAVESALMQQTTFPVEIIIGDDESDDGAREICREYADKYPDRIRLFLRSRKDVIYINGHPTGRNNFIQNISSAKGKYIALLPGDDYWTDPLKLQKQVEILESNSDCVACHHWHRVTVRNEQGIFTEKQAPREGQGYSAKQKATVRDIFANEVRLKSRTVMFRNIFLDGFRWPDWFRTVQFGDVAVSMILGKFGDFYFIDEEMAVYRMTGSGVSTMGSRHYLFNYRHFTEWIRIWEKADRWFDGKYRDEAFNAIKGFYVLIYRHYKSAWWIFLRTVLFALINSRLPVSLRFRMTRELFRERAKTS